MSFHSYISEDSTISNNSKAAFRVSICLKRYFKDFRARCYILVKRNRRVRWLERRLQKIFAISGTFCLCTNGHFLPSSERLALLRPEDSLEVIPMLEEYMEMPQNKDSLPINLNNQLENEKNSGSERNDLVHSQHINNSFQSITNQNQITSNEAETKKVSNMSEDDSDVSMLMSKDNVDGEIEKNNLRCTADFDVIIKKNVTKPKIVNGYSDTNDMPYSLQELKHQALALLDSQCSAQGGSEAEVEEPPLKRTRRRVRRRSRRTNQMVPISDQALLPTELSLTTPPESFIASDCVPTEHPAADVVNTLVEVPKALSLPPEVARNEAACSRKPRVVRSLDIEN